MSEKEAREFSSPTVESVQVDQLADRSTNTKEDEALEYLKQHAAEGHFAHDVDRMRRLRRRIDIRVIPFLTLAYLMNFVDKILINVSVKLLMITSESIRLTGDISTPE